MFHYKKICLFACTMTLALQASSSAYAQLSPVESATSTADPARIAQDLLNDPVLPEVAPQTEIQRSDIKQEAPEGAENITFILTELVLDGANAYASDEFLSVYGDKIGTQVSLDDIYQISSTLTNKYRNDGYILTQVVVPPQEISGGVVKLDVIEGFIDQIIIQGEPSLHAQKQIEKIANKIRGENIVNAKVLEHYLLLINDLPGVSARSVLSPSRTTTGASDLTIIIERKKFEGQVSYNNESSRFLGPYSGVFSATANSFLGYNDRLSAQFVINGDIDDADELLFGSLIYEQPIFDHGTTLRLFGSVTGTEPGAGLEEFDVVGRSRFIGGALTHPFIRSRTTNLTGRIGFDFRTVESENNLEATREDRISSFRAGATYQFIDTLLGVGVNAVDVEFSIGTGLFGASSEGDANLTRDDGDPTYQKLEVQLQRLQRLSPKLNLLLAAQGQLSNSALLSSEEFGVGGSNFGRGFDPSEIVGDEGFVGKLELQWNEPYKVPYLSDYQLFAFYDVGRVFNQDATTTDEERASLASTGLGLRADINDSLDVRFTFALPLTRAVDSRGDSDPRYLFNLTQKF